MNQISIGDSSSWINIDGLSVAAPYRRAAPFFNYSSDPFVKEKIEITLFGTSSQINDALISLSKIAVRAIAFERGEYAHCQYIRYQPYGGGSYYYTKISEINLVQNPTGYRDHTKGSLLVELQYTRPNYFDGTQFQVPLTGRAGSEITGGIQIVNHTDADALDGNTLLINPGDVSSFLPAPLRLEIQNNTPMAAWYRILVGVYHHPTYNSEGIFFFYPASMIGGTLSNNPTMISGQLRSLSFTSSTFTTFLTCSIPSANIINLDGRSYRPVLNLTSGHAYSDLHMRLKIRYSTFALHYTEAVYCDPNYDYVIFPPIQLPPNQLLHESSPQWIEIDVQGLREGGVIANLYTDCMMLLPVDYSMTFNQFIPLTGVSDTLIYDEHLGLSNVRYSGFYECVSHIRQGGPLLLYPGDYTRLFFNFYNASNVLTITDTAIIKAYYRPRTKLL